MEKEDQPSPSPQPLTMSALTTTTNTWFATAANMFANVGFPCFGVKKNKPTETIPK